MDIYYSSVGSIKGLENILKVKIGILSNYWDFRKKQIEKPVYCDKLFLDSGAYPAFTRGITINVEDYIDYIDKLILKPEVVCSLDDIQSSTISLKNFLIMKEEKGLDVLPCYHVGEPISILKEYVSKTNCIGLGGIAMANKRSRIEFLDGIFSLYPDPKEVGFHGFGIQDVDIMKRYPWKSIDASSAHVSARYGGIFTPWIKGGHCNINFDVGESDFGWNSPKKIAIIAEWVGSLDLGFSFKEAQENTTEGTNKRLVINIHYFESLKKEVPKYFEPKNINHGFGL